MHSDGVICISENTKRDLYHFYPEYKGKVKVIYHGYDNSLFCNKNYNQRTNNVVFVGQRGGYKNFNLAVKILSQIEGLNLVIIGGGDLNNIELSMLNNYLPNRYKKLNFIPNEELVHLYNSSFALIYPSSYEGFGFPIIEAQACGCPVICQQVSSIPEVSGDKCVYISDSNLVKSVENVKQLFNQHSYIKIQCDGLENVKRFSWDKCIKDTKEFYESF
jgi:mannosyltransferase